MARLIDADALMAEMHNVILEDGEDRRTFYEVIERQPTIEPERKKGKWEQVEVSYLADMDADIKETMAIASMFCPVCQRYHNEVYLYGDPKYGVNFCPTCGADMRGDEHDD